MTAATITAGGARRRGPLTAPGAAVPGTSYSYTTPVIAAAVGVVALGEPLWAGAFLGGGVVLAAVALEVRARTA